MLVADRAAFHLPGYQKILADAREKSALEPKNIEII
jgi:hypothetical protein